MRCGNLDGPLSSSKPSFVISYDEGHNLTALRLEASMVAAAPKCIEHNLALQLIRVEVSQDNLVTDVYGCPHLGCATEYSRQQPRRTVEAGR
jgi:hypothetical protein